MNLKKCFTLTLTSKKCDKSLIWTFSLDEDSPQASDLALYFGDLSQSEKKSEIKPPLELLRLPCLWSFFEIFMGRFETWWKGLKYGTVFFVKDIDWQTESFDVEKVAKVAILNILLGTIIFRCKRMRSLQRVGQSNCDSLCVPQF